MKKFNLKNLLLALLGIFLLAVFILSTIYLVTRKVVNQDIANGPNPTIEFQKYIEDKSITKTYIGDLPCEDCDGISLSLSLTKESEEMSEGSFTLSRTYLGSEKDAEIKIGSWNMDTEGNLILIPNDKSGEINLEKIDEDTFSFEDEEIKLLN